MQSYGVNFTETWAPTAAARSVRLVISIAAMRNDKIRHIDIKSAYLNAKLTETVFVQPPAGYAQMKCGYCRKLFMDSSKLEESGIGCSNQC